MSNFYDRDSLAKIAYDAISYFCVRVHHRLLDMVLNIPIRILRPCLIHAPKTEVNRFILCKYLQYSGTFKQSLIKNKIKKIQLNIHFCQANIIKNLIKKTSSNTTFRNFGFIIIKKLNFCVQNLFIYF